jgi:hypothetical protein
MAGEFALTCEVCGQEVFRGTEDQVAQICLQPLPILCDDHMAEEEWREDLADRYLRDQYDLMIRAKEEVSRWRE